MDYKEVFPQEILPMSLLEIVTFNTDHTCSVKVWRASAELLEMLAEELGEPASEALIDPEHLQGGLDVALPGMSVLHGGDHVA